jgi:type 1 glutamine amidotransferase
LLIEGDVLARRMKMKRGGMILFCVVALAWSLAIPEIQNVLHFTKIAGYNPKDAIRACGEALDNLALKHGFRVKHSRNAMDILNLEQFDVVVFDNNVANGGFQKILESKEEQQALINYIEGGGSWLGFCGTLDFDCTGWEWYYKTLSSGNCWTGHGGVETWTLKTDKDLIGDPELSAMWEDGDLNPTVTFEAHKPRLRKGTDPSLRDNPGVTVMQKVLKEDEDYDDHYLTWTKRIGRGRIIYTALGHTEAFWYQNDGWLERATWHWMKYLDGHYGKPVMIHIENRQVETVRATPFKAGPARFYLVNGRIAATYPNGIIPGIRFYRKSGQGACFGKIKYSSSD